MSGVKTTARGFHHLDFSDANGEACSIQQSSAWRENDFNEDEAGPGQTMLWLGVDNASPQIMRSDARKLGLPNAEGNGWMPYPLPQGVHCTTRMHLTRAQAAAIGEMLTHWANTGEIKAPEIGVLIGTGEVS